MEIEKYKELYETDAETTKMKKHRLMMQAIENVKARGEESSRANLEKEKEKLFRENGIY